MVYNRNFVENFFIRGMERKVSGIEREIKISSMKNKAISIIGPRRTGKTWLLLSILEKVGGMYVDFSHQAFKKLEPQEFWEIIKIYSEVTGKKPTTLFLDEVQELKDWESVVRSLLDEGYEIFLTGSSSKLLAREIATQLRGRTISYTLLGFSFREFLRAKGFEIKKYYTFEEKGILLNFLKEYLIDGFYPEVIFNKDKKEFIWKNYFNEIFYMDFLERHKIKNFELARFLIEFCFQNFSSAISINKIYNFIRKSISITPRSLYEYISKLEETLNIFFVRKYSEKIYERASWPRKVYVCDVGLTNLLSYSENLGKRMENCVFLELIRKTNDNPLMEIFYLKVNNKEVDFVVKEGLRRKQLIQVTYASNKDEIEQREIKALEKAYELFKKDKPELLIITWDYEDIIKSNNLEIKYIPLWKWLL